MLTDKELRTARRDIEATHDAVEEKHNKLKEEYAFLKEQLHNDPRAVRMRQIDEELHTLTYPLHAKRCELGGKIREAVAAVEAESQERTG